VVDRATIRIALLVALASLGLVVATAGTAQGAPFEIKRFDAEFVNEAGGAEARAGAHPFEVITDVQFPTNSEGPEGNIRDVKVALPKGLVGDPTAVPTCAAELLREPPACPPASQIGVAMNRIGFPGVEFTLPSAIYNMEPRHGTPGQFAFVILANAIYINPHVRTGGDYGVDADTVDINQGVPIVGSTLHFWGVPAAAAHDAERGGPSPATPRPFLTMPTACEGPLGTGLESRSWQEPANVDSAASLSHLPGEPEATYGLDGCEVPDFSPSFAVKPSVAAADSPTGLTVSLRIPQNENPGGIAAANLKDAVVRLPQGMTVNPSLADGLQACVPGQIGLDSEAPPSCPDASKIGAVRMTTPLLDHPLPGSVYVAAPHDNPFGSLLAIYIAIDDPESGVVVKLAGHVEADPQSGQLTVGFEENPQLPFEELVIELDGGPRAPLITPLSCGAYEATSRLTPWTAPAGEAATLGSSFPVSRAAAGGSCPNSDATAPHAPKLEAGSLTPIAGAFSPFLIRVSREDGSQRLAALNLTLPKGVLGKLASVPYCSEGALAAALGRSGAAEADSPSCPAVSRIGSVDVGVGAGPLPFHVGGAVYLAGPYKGAPLSAAVVTPALAGPFDLGTVVVRSPLEIDPVTTEVTVRSDSIPQILQGIPLDLRSVAIELDRPGFATTPTSCRQRSVSGSAISMQGGVAPLGNRYQVGACAALGFKPQLRLEVSGPTRRGGYPALKATLRMPAKGQANIARAAVTLPHSEFLEQAHIRTICTRVQYAADTCPKASVYGYAKAWSPLLDKPLRGPVYLRSSNHPLPDLVASLDGQIHVDLAGRIDSKDGGIRTTFARVPDAPVSKFVLQMKGGKKGLLVNSRNLCAGPNRAKVRIEGHNGVRVERRTQLKNDCGGKR
jgi:hypothetical protein